MTAVDLHNEAMELAEQALSLGREGDSARERKLFEQAFEREKEAATSLLDREDVEPSRSVLFRSAAALARDAGRYGDALDMVKLGLSGTPPEGIRNELKALMRDVLAELLSLNSSSVRQPGDDAAHVQNAPYASTQTQKLRTGL